MNFDYVDEMIFVARRPLQNSADVQAVVERGFRSVLVLNDASTQAQNAMRDASVTDALLAKHVQCLRSDVPMTTLVELGDGRYEKFEKDYSEARFDKVVSLLDVAPRPTLVVSAFASHSNEAALAVVYTYVATRHARVAGVAKLSPAMREFVETYVETKISRIMLRNPVLKYEGGIWAAAQPSQEEFRRFAALGAKSVLNIRDGSEIGKVGLGVLAIEPQLVRDLNMDYFAVPVVNGEDATIAMRLEAVREALKIAPKPVVFHCASRQRIDKLAKALGLKLEEVKAAPAVVAK